MYNLFFASLILCIIAFIDVITTIRRPYFLKFLFLSLVTNIFLINFLLFTNNKESFLFYLFPILNSSTGIIFILITNYFISNSIFNWVKISLTFTFLLSITFSIIITLNPEFYNFHNDYVTSFYILPSFRYIEAIRILFKLIIAFVSFKLLYDVFKSHMNTNNLYKITLKSWLIRFSYLATFVLFNFLVLIFNKMLFASIFLNITIIIMSYFTLLNIIYKPKFLGYYNFARGNLNYFDRNMPIILNDKNFIIPFFKNQFYLKKDANLDFFCKENLINDKEDFQDEIILNYNMTFNNLINKLRVQYLTDIIKSKKYNNYSIDALAQEAGFSSRHHLYKPFKKFHGGTPSDYIYLTNN